MGNGIPIPDPGISPTTPVDLTTPSGGTVAVQNIGRANLRIRQKERRVKDLAGEPMFPGLEGQISVPGGGFFREYAHGKIFYKLSVADEAFYVNRAEQRYAQLGGPQSFLGWPISDDVADPGEPGSGVTKFQSGAIYWFSDIGAIEMQHVSLRYAGLQCFGETDELSGSDEPYVTFGVVPMITALANTVQTEIYEEVNAGSVRFDDLELYRGLPFGVALSITLAEHDEGNPDK
jgi:uncharacterized protein with LGFP repeats